MTTQTQLRLNDRNFFGTWFVALNATLLFATLWVGAVGSLALLAGINGAVLMLPMAKRLAARTYATRARIARLSSTASLLLLAACSGGADANAADKAGDAAMVQAAEQLADADPPAVPAPTPTPNGPEMLSTVGLYEREPLQAVDAAHGRFAIEEVDGIPTLTVGGRPARYLPGGEAGTPVNVAANAELILVGVFELPGESVAWALVTGGGACPGTHILVPARGGQPLPGQEVPGCDDRGTMRRADGRIVFEAGGSTGSYADGLISVESAG